MQTVSLYYNITYVSSFERKSSEHHVNIGALKKDFRCLRGIKQLQKCN